MVRGSWVKKFFIKNVYGILQELRETIKAKMSSPDSWNLQDPNLYLY
jgi:hypothetical protein